MNRPTAILLTLLLTATIATAKEFFVSPGGSDANAGTEARPFKSLAKALDAARAGGAPATIHLLEGVHYLDDTLRLTAADSALTFKGRGGNKPSISGGRVITGFKPGADNIWTVQLDEVKNGDWWFRQLYVDNQRLPRGRYPQEGFLKIKSVSKDHRTIQLTSPLPEIELGDTEIIVAQNWSISRELITGNTADKISTATPTGWLGHSHCLPKKGMSVFFEHALAFLKKPGQWYLDRGTGVLHYKAAEGEDPNTRVFIAPKLEQLVTVNGGRNIRFEGIRFEHTAFNLPKTGYGGIQGCYYGTTVEEATTYAVDAAIELNQCVGCVIADCTVTRTGGSGIGIGAGCCKNQIVGCRITDIGANGINIGHMKIKDPLWADWPDAADVPVANEVGNCLIRHCGAELWGAHGIFDAMTRDSHIHHNEVSDMPYGAIATGYVWSTDRTSQQGCVIEYNHIHEVMLKLNDSGCIYTLGFQPGSIIRGNLMHGVRFGGFAGGQVCNNGIFFDEGSKGFLLEDNVIYDVDQKKGAKNTAVRFNRSNREWQIWINNTITTDDEAPEAAKVLAEKAGLEPQFRHLLKKGN